MSRRLLLPLLLLLLLLPGRVFAREAREDKRIAYLLGCIGSLRDAKFIRNGTEYDAPAAEKHLRQKLDYGGERLKTAEQFIEYCATKSSLSGRAYRIRFTDGQPPVEAGPFLRGKLAEFDRTPR